MAAATAPMHYQHHHQHHHPPDPGNQHLSSLSLSRRPVNASASELSTTMTTTTTTTTISGFIRCRCRSLGLTLAHSRAISEIRSLFTTTSTKASNRSEPPTPTRPLWLGPSPPSLPSFPPAVTEVEDPSFKVAKVSYNNGTIQMLNMRTSQLKQEAGIYARDLFILNLTSRQERYSQKQYRKQQQPSSATASGTNPQQQQQQQQQQQRTARPDASKNRGSNNSGWYHQRQRTAVTAIIPRRHHNLMVVSFGQVRAVAGVEAAYLFDAHKLPIQDFAHQLAQSYQWTTSVKTSRNTSARSNLSTSFVPGTRKEEHQNDGNAESTTASSTPSLVLASTSSLSSYANSFGDQASANNIIHTDDQVEPMEPNELIFLEHVLRSTVDAFYRRLRLYQPVLDSFLDKVDDQVYSDTGAHQLVPLRDSLTAFEMEVKQSLDCVTSLLNNDDDMLALLLTEQAAATQQGQTVDFRRHEHVEWLLGLYARQLHNLVAEIQYCLSRIQSKQEFVVLALSSFRNRMVRTNVHIGIAGLAIGLGTVVAGFFGMNVPNGVEQVSVAFPVIVLTSSVGGMLVAAGSLQYLSSRSMQQRASQRLKEIETLSSALSDMCALDYTFQSTIERGVTMNKQQFCSMLQKARQSKAATPEEVDLLFDVYDKIKDGHLSSDDMLSWDQLATPTTSFQKADQSHHDHTPSLPFTKK